MPVDLPPPAYVQEAVFVVTLSNGQRLEVSGATGLPEQRVQAAVSVASSAEEAARRLQSAYAEAGFALIQVRVEPAGQASRLVVVHGRLSEFSGPDGFRQYFAGVLDRPGVTHTEVRTPSARADKAAAREGRHIEVVDVPTGSPGQHRLVVESEELPQWRPVGASLSAGNYGNRYAGRDIGNANVRLNPGSGTQLDMQFAKHLNRLSENNKGADYRRGGLMGSIASRWGIYGLNGAVTNYRTGSGQRLTLPEKTEGSILQFSGWGEQLLYASRKVSWSVTEAIHHVGNEVDLPANVRLFEQDYTFAEFGTAVQWKPSWAEQATLHTRIWIGQGLGGDFDRIRGNPTNALQVGGALELNIADTIFVGGGGEVGGGADLGDFPIALSPAAASGGALRTPKEDFSLLGLNVGYRHPLPASLEFSATLNGQYTDGTMPEMQQFVLGGFGELTGWLPGVAEGDRGGLMRLRLTHTGLHLGKLGLGLSAYVEGGATEFAHPFRGAEGWQTLVDAGIAITGNTSFGTRVTVAYAEPISSSNVPAMVREAERADVYFQVEQRF